MNEAGSNLHAEPAHYAGFWIRAVASVLDGAILGAASWLVELMVLGILYWIRPKDAAPFSPFTGQVMIWGLYTIASIPYYVLGHYRWGTTLGKYPLKVYVVSMQSRGPISMKQSVIRCLGYAVSELPFGAGYLMAAIHPEKRALHDLMAGTVSVRLPKHVKEWRG